MEMQTGVITAKQKYLITEATETVKIPSSLPFLKEQNGLRPGELSVLVGQKGTGKSALLKTFAVDAAAAGCTVLHILSEEKCEIYKHNQSKYVHWLCEGQDTHPDFYLRRMHYDSMLDWPDEFHTCDFFFQRLIRNIQEKEPDLIVFDNFTTAMFDEMPIGIQGRAIRMLRSIAKEHDVAIVAAFHTKKGTNPYNGLLTGEDVKGSSTSTNSGSYNYILTTCFFEKPVAFLFVDKARYHTNVNKTVWILDFSTTFGIYRGARKSTEREVVELIQSERKKSSEKAGPKWRK